MADRSWATLPESAAKLPESRPARPFPRAPGLPGPAHDAQGLPRPPFAPSSAWGAVGAQNGGGSCFGPLWHRSPKRIHDVRCRFPPSPVPSGHLVVYRPERPPKPLAAPWAYSPRPGGPGAPYAGPWAGLPGGIGSRAALPGTRPRPRLAQVTRNPAQATLPKGPSPSHAGRRGASRNRPRPEGRPPPRRFAVFEPGYPGTGRGPPPGALLTDPGALLGCRARLGGLWCTLRISDKRVCTAG